MKSKNWKYNWLKYRTLINKETKGTAHLNCKTTTYEVKLQSCDIPIDTEQIVTGEWGRSVYAHVVLRTVAEEVFRSFN